MPRYVEAGCGLLIVHAESTRHLHRSLGRVRELGARAAVALNPATPAVAVEDVLDLCDMVLVMTVNPGFGGQDYIASMEPKIRRIRQLIVDGGHDCDLEVDGGIGPATVAAQPPPAPTCSWPGPPSTAIPLGLEHAVSELRGLASATRTADPQEP